MPRNPFRPHARNTPGTRLPSADLPEGWRKCEFCDCKTNAKARACCEKGRAADLAGSAGNGGVPGTLKTSDGGQQG